jgi:hypothetical protein
MLLPLYRKGKIFKSRAARATPPPPAPKPESSDVIAEPFAAFEEPPRVPPVSRHFVELGNSGSSRNSGTDAATINTAAAAAANGKGVHDVLSALSPDKPDTKVRYGRKVSHIGTPDEPSEEQCKKITMERLDQGHLHHKPEVPRQKTNPRLRSGMRAR